MSDAPDPIDKAYVEAEAVLSDDAARAARRARVLAAVAEGGAPAAPSARPRPWRRGGWLVAASVSALALFLGSQLYRPAPYPLPKPAVAPAAVPTASAPAPSAPAAASVAASPPVTARPAASPPAAAPATMEKAQSPSGAVGASVVGGIVAGAEKREAPNNSVPVAVTAFTSKERDLAGVSPPSPKAVPFPAAPMFRAAPVPPPAPPPTPTEADAAQAAPPATNRPAALAEGAASGAVVTDEIVTAEKRPSRHALTDAARLRAAAAAGRTAEVEALLRHGAPVDLSDVDGDTALMASVKADHPATVAALMKHGADPDQTNADGQNARDVAKVVGDPKLDQALGLAP